jgi:aryl-alcohol dehydrogenase-like predicted oxidoreductase
MIRFVETGMFEAVITHNRYTLVNRTAEPLLNVAKELGVAALNAAPYGSGILAKGPDAYTRYEYKEAPQELVERVRAMQEACKEFDVPLAAALQFYTFGGKPVYSVWAYNEESGFAVIKTVYRPDPTRWEPDWKTRRR